jgi:hypothetical protein
MTSRHLVALAVLFVLLVMAVPVQATRVHLGEDLVVDFEPDRLSLKHRERGTVELTVTNTGNRTLGVMLVHLTIKSPGASGGTIDPSFFTLQGGQSASVTVIVESYASYLGANGISDCHIDVRWGPDLDPESPNSTVEGQARIIIPVDDDFTVERLVVIGLVAMLVAIAVAVVWLVRGSARHRRGGREGAHDNLN